MRDKLGANLICGAVSVIGFGQAAQMVDSARSNGTIGLMVMPIGLILGLAATFIAKRPEWKRSALIALATWAVAVPITIRYSVPATLGGWSILYPKDRQAWEEGRAFRLSNGFEDPREKVAQRFRAGLLACNEGHPWPAPEGGFLIPVPAPQTRFVLDTFRLDSTSDKSRLLPAWERAAQEAEKLAQIQYGPEEHNWSLSLTCLALLLPTFGGSLLAIGSINGILSLKQRWNSRRAKP